MVLNRLKTNPFLFVYVYAFLLLVGASVPTEGFRKFQDANVLFSVLFSDYALHFFGFGIMAWLLCYGYHRVKKIRWPYFRAGIVSVAYGFFIELVHILLPYRAFALVDLAMDAAGVLFALVLYFLFLGKK